MIGKQQALAHGYSCDDESPANARAYAGIHRSTDAAAGISFATAVGFGLLANLATERPRREKGQKIAVVAVEPLLCVVCTAVCVCTYAHKESRFAWFELRGQGGLDGFNDAKLPV